MSTHANNLRIDHRILAAVNARLSVAPLLSLVLILVLITSSGAG
ncbi:MAG TPA: hypothetical protein VF269_09075 [Rhodanobacteraceae bacterium]